MNKKAYTKAEIEIVYFTANDVIVASAGDEQTSTFPGWSIGGIS